MQLFIPSPQTLASSPAPRSGVTLTEVLISIGILAVGLLGAAAMFPVGSYFMQKGEVADRGAAIAQAAFADLVARGDLNPDNWRAWDPSLNDGNGAYASMGQTMRNWMANNSTLRANSEVDFQTQMNAAAGFVYVIDPLGTAGAFRAGDSTRMQLTMAPMRFATPPGFTATEFESWPVRRLCTNSMVMGDQLPSEPVARSLYMSGDDIAFDLPEEDDQPSQQQVIGPDADGDDRPDSALARQNRGDYSWMAMVAPTQSDAREALGLNPSAYYFDVSVIVFYKRPIASISSTESLVKGYIVATGTGGGEILLDSDPLTDAYDDFKVGQWVMVSAPHPSSSPTEPLFFTQWYRVLSINEDPDNQTAGDATFNNETTQRRIGLRGPDWPWKKAGTPVRVGIFPGAVAVHTKTMRLESQGPYSR